MIARKIFALGLALTLLGGCAPAKLTLEQFYFEPGVSGPLKGGYFYYLEASGDLIMGAIVYRVENPGPNDSELIVVANGITESMWRKIVPALISAGGQVAAAGVFGISIPVAKTVISAVAGGGAGGAGGQGGSSSATTGAVNNTNSATGGSSTATGTGGAGGSSTSTATGTGGAGGSSTNTNTNNTCTGNNSC